MNIADIRKQLDDDQFYSAVRRINENNLRVRKQMNDLSRLKPKQNGEKRLAPHGVLLTSELTDDELLALDKLYYDAISKREEASKHEKFKKMELPPVNPLFTMKHNEVKDEIKKRKSNPIQSTSTDNKSSIDETLPNSFKEI